MNGACFLGIDVDPARIAKRIETGYCDRLARDLDDALLLIDEARRQGKALSVGVVGNCADLIPELASRGLAPDIVTDQTSAHDPLNGYVPNGMSLDEALALRQRDPEEYVRRSMEAMGKHVEGMLALQKAGAVVFDYGNNLRTQAKNAGVADAFHIPGFVPEYIRPMFCEGRGPFRWVALSGDPKDIYRTERLARELFPKNEALLRWMTLARERIHFQGLPSRIGWLGYGERAKFGVAMNRLVRSGEIKAPIVIGRDHLDAGSVASPFRETEAMLDGSDAIADWPLLNAMVNTAAGASWVSIHHGGGVGIGYSLHAGMVVVADGTDESERRLERVLTTDPGTGVIRHADAGYEQAVQFADEHDIALPCGQARRRSESRRATFHLARDFRRVCRECCQRKTCSGRWAVAALSACLAASLLKMVLEIMAKDGSDVAGKLAAVETARKQLQNFVEEDISAFNSFLAARRLPQITEMEKVRRLELITQALQRCTEVPLRAAQTAASLVPILKGMVGLAPEKALSDFGVALAELDCGFVGLSFTVNINLRGTAADANFVSLRAQWKELTSEVANARQALAVAIEHVNQKIGQA